MASGLSDSLYIPFLPEKTQSVLKWIRRALFEAHIFDSLWGKREFIGSTERGSFDSESCLTKPMQLMTISGLAFEKAVSISFSNSTSILYKHLERKRALQFSTLLFERTVPYTLNSFFLIKCFIRALPSIPEAPKIKILVRLLDII